MKTKARRARREQCPSRGGGLWSGNIWAKTWRKWASFLSIGSSECKDPEAGACLELSRKSKELSVTEVEWRGRGTVTHDRAQLILKHPWMSGISLFIVFLLGGRDYHYLVLYFLNTVWVVAIHRKIEKFLYYQMISFSGRPTFENCHVTILFLPNDLLKTEILTPLRCHTYIALNKICQQKAYTFIKKSRSWFFSFWTLGIDL